MSRFWKFFIPLHWAGAKAAPSRWQGAVELERSRVEMSLPVALFGLSRIWKFSFHEPMQSSKARYRQGAVKFLGQAN